VRIPAANKDWHPIAKRFYNSLKTSGQSDFYQNSDWAFAYSVADDLSYYKKPLVNRDGEEYNKRSGQMLQSIYRRNDEPARHRRRPPSRSYRTFRP